MGISTIGGAPAASALNRSQVFTSSGNFTVPSGVTYVHATLRGGNGTARTDFINDGVNGATAGGNTTFAGNTANGGPGGVARRQGDPLGSTNGISFGQGPGHAPVILNFFVQTTPGASMPVVIGTGTGAYAVISWAA